MARDLNEFWQNLTAGKDCISEIPKDRWDWRKFYGDPVKQANKTNIKWGGFIDGVDEFDPLFFGISPKEARFIDPQQRLLMIYTWKAIEDAGYSAQSLAGTQTGIFVGTASSGYASLIAKADMAIEGYSSTGMVSSIGPNRMSYFLNIHGPSEPIETACSSSLVAMHRAVSAIQNGTCEMAIVGGVNTMVTPEPHISFSKAGMLSEDGRCKTFSDQANGYVRSEGVGMVFLKKLQAAQQAGDHVYGVIREVAENHGGRANSLTAPNPKAQTQLLKTAYTNAGIDPRTVTYIEAHGTGTELGDPVEINGLKKAFQELYQATGDPKVMESHCGLGSVKSNIGHLELAAGIAGVVKVLLQLKHKTLVKSLHCDSINPYIQLKDSPFYIVQENRKWISLKDALGKELPRRAGVSSFGFGGANAHVVLEEYIPKTLERQQIRITHQNPAIIVLSAKNEERLKEQARQLLTAIWEDNLTDNSLADMAYTLQVGRETMEHRLALLAGSIQGLEEKLQNFVAGQDGMEDFFRGQVKSKKGTLAVLAMDEDMAKTIDAWIAKGKYTKLLDLWVNGLSFDWNRLHDKTTPCRISLPTYPFAKERHWVSDIKPKPGDKSAAADVSSLPAASGVKVTFPEVSSKPKKVSLKVLSDEWNLSSKRAGQVKQSGALSPVAISSPQPRSNDESGFASQPKKASTLESIQEELMVSLAEALYIDRSDVDVDKSFIDMGLDSVVGVEWVQMINKQYQTSITATKFYNYPNIRELAGFLKKELDAIPTPSLPSALPTEEIESKNLQAKSTDKIEATSRQFLTHSLDELPKMRRPTKQSSNRL